MIEIALLAGAGGATLARLVTKEDGPFKIFPRFAAWAAKRAREIESNPPKLLRAIFDFFSKVANMPPDDFRAEACSSFLDLLACPICQSVWWGGALALVLGLCAGLAPVWIVASMVAAPSIAWAIGETGHWMN